MAETDGENDAGTAGGTGLNWERIGNFIIQSSVALVLCSIGMAVGFVSNATEVAGGMTIMLLGYAAWHLWRDHQDQKERQA